MNDTPDDFAAVLLSRRYALHAPLVVMWRERVVRRKDRHEQA